ncbi:MAG: PAS domain-containing protein [Proteobacteria bacterium]|nr:PAS domain-containing protein [Pseudomonadota bacterium]
MPQEKRTPRPSSVPAPPGQGLDQQAAIKNVVASMSDGLMVINQDGEIVFTNPALTGILDLLPDQMLGRGWAELFFKDPANREFNQIIVDIITESIYHYNKQVTYKVPAGGTKDLIITTALLPSEEDGKEVGGVLVMFKDVSELTQMHRRSRELLRQSRRLFQEKLEGLDRLARAVAHEIRNPVTTIGGLAGRLLADKPPESRDARYLQRILDGTARLERMVEEVRIYADLPAPVRRPANLAEWLGKVVAPFRSLAKKQGVRLSLSGAGKGHQAAEAMIDPPLLAKVLEIILTNALEAMPQGGQLKVGLMCDSVSGVIAVSDTGKGMSPADLPYVFDPFFTTKADAVGMSLAIAKRIALEHQGDITVASRPGCGTTFTLTIPQDGGLGGELDTEAQSRPPEMK